MHELFDSTAVGLLQEAAQASRTIEEREAGSATPTRAQMASKPEDARGVAYEILRSLRSILHQIKVHSKQLGKQAGLTLPQIVCLLAISESADGEVTSVEVSRSVELSAPTVTGILDRLERSGHIRRVRGTRDRRKVYASLTDTGRERMASLPTPLQTRFIERLLALEAGERRQLLASLERIATLMGAPDPTAPVPVRAAPVLFDGDQLAGRGP